MDMGLIGTVCDQILVVKLSDVPAPKQRRIVTHYVQITKDKVLG